jgi:glucosylceramidase
MRLGIAAVLLLLCLAAESALAQTVNVWITTHSQSQKLAAQPPVSFSPGTGGNNPVFVDEAQVYQEVEGFGASFTDSAAYLLNRVATPAARTNAMNNLFTRNGSGIGVSFVRNPMGASDLARYHYSYDDNPPGGTDPNLTHFSIAHDQADIIPLVQQALQLNPQLKVMASPWSPPGWMKDSGSMVGGSLLPGMYRPFANYFARYIKAYEAAGIPTHYISLQNEPLYVPGDYPGMYMDAAAQRTILRDHILPVLVASNIATKVLVYDHNWDGAYYPETVLSDSTVLASSRVAGTAWHGYGGSPGVMLALANQFPTKGNYQTEHSGGTWVGGDANQIVNDFEEITHVMRSAGKAFVKWSLVLDQNRGPNDGGCDTCTPLVTVNSHTGNVSYEIDYYTLGHFSKFILPGAHRIYSANASGVVSAAFLNPDGSKALVAFNDTTTSRTFQVQWGNRSFSYTLAGFSGATFTWTGMQSGGYTVNPANQIQASSFDIMSGLVTESTADTQGGYNLGYADNNDYAVYRKVNFIAGLTNVSVRVASFGGGTVEFRLDSPNGSLICSLAIPNTGGWQTWQTVGGAASTPTGLHDLYLVFKGGSSIGNVNWFQFEGAAPVGPPGPATQLVWTTQPGLATNGLPFAQQPVLVTADQYGTPSSNGLPATLEVVITQTAGTGPLVGSTNLNIGTSGWNGVVQFADLQIDSAGTDKQLTAATATFTNIPSGNLLLNGDFNNPASGDPATDWTSEAIGGGWANHENNVGVTYDGSHYLVAGASGNGGGRFRQTVAATAGVDYQLSVLSGADAWWLPTGRMTLSFLNAGNNLISNVSRTTVDPAVYGQNFNIPHPWANYVLTATSPTGTAKIRVEFSSNESSVGGSEGTATGSVWFENAVLAQLVSVPVLASSQTLPFTVQAYLPPTSETNHVVGIIDNGGGTFTLQFVGTVGVPYYVEATTNLIPPITWEAVSGSTNVVLSPDGLWDHVVTNVGWQQFFRSAVATP